MDRTVTDTRQIRTSYQISKTDYHMIKILKEIESVFSR